MTPIEKILARTKADLAARQKQKAFPLLATFAKAAPKPAPFESALRRATGRAVIAELKRQSPAQGVVDRELDPTAFARDAAEGGAAAISVATDTPFFGGTLDDVGRARKGAPLAVLRKDLIVDPYQVAETRVAGGSAVTLVGAVLDAKTLGLLLRECRTFALDAVVEVRSEAELNAALDAGAAIVAVGLRDLKTGARDAEIGKLAAAAKRAGTLVVAAGIETADDVRRAADAGAEAFVTGAAFMRAADRAAFVRGLVGA